MGSNWILFSCSIILLSCDIIVEAVVGINWGRQTTQRLIPSMVVDMLLQNNIHELRMFSHSENVMDAFAGSGIRLTITVPNFGVWQLVSPHVAKHFVNKWVTEYREQKQVDIRYVNVGTEPFSTTFYDQTFPSAFEALKQVQNALNNNGYLDKVKATIPHFIDVLIPNITKPSEADFRSDIKEKMVELLQFMYQSNAPFTINIFPIHYVQARGWNPEFAFVDNKSHFTILDDNGIRYMNVFDFLHDSVVWALKKAGVPQMKLIIGQIGWPTDGYPGANIANAERFYKGLLPKVTSNKGTPMRPGAPIDVYLHSMTDESKNIISRGTFQRHWGIFSFDGTPKYKIDFTGKGRDIYPTIAKGVTYLPKRWCVFNKNVTSVEEVKKVVDDTCQICDCTNLAPGGSCSHLDFIQNVSYIFNMRFQDTFQQKHEMACDFNGFGIITTDDPSNGTCKFPIDIITADERSEGGIHGKFLGKR